MYRRLFTTVVVALLALAAVVPATAGGFGIARLAAPVDAVVVGKAVDVELEVLGHGMEGEPVMAGPTIRILAKHTESGQELRAQATLDETSRSYRATITFPQAGTWKWSATDGGYVIASPLPEVAVSDVGASTADEPDVAKRTVKVEVTDGGFILPDEPIRVGQTIVWSNTGSLAHIVMSSDVGFEDVPLLQPGDWHETVARTAGTFQIFCTPHSGMVAKLVIEE